MHLVEGMADGSLAVISKFHLAFMDGSAGMAPVAALFDLSPNADVSPLQEHRAPEPIPSRWQLLLDTPGDVLARARQVPTAVMGTLAGTAGLIGAMFPGRSPRGRRSMARRTPFNGALSEARKVERLQDLHRLGDQAEARHRAMGVDLIERWATLVPPWMISSGARLAGRYDLAAHLPPVFNPIVSNVAGPPVPIYLAAPEVIGTYPLGPLIGGAGLNVTVISHRNRLHIGVIADPSLVKAPTRLAEGIVDGVAELFGMTSSSANLQTADR